MNTFFQKLRVHLGPRIQIHFIYSHRIWIQLLGGGFGPQPTRVLTNRDRHTDGTRFCTFDEGGY